MKLEAIAEFLKNHENLNVELTESGLVVTEKELNEKNIIPSDLSSFVGVYEQTEIVKSGSGYAITVERMSANNFMKLLASVFASEYKFEVTGEYTITATPKSANESLEDEVNNYSYEDIAEAIDAEGVEIEIHEDGLKITAKDLMSLAEKIDSMNPNLDIQVTDDYLTVMDGEK